MMTISLVFLQCTPYVCVAGTLWFFFAGYVYRWLVLYSETKKPDLGGVFWDQALKHLYFSLALYQLVMVAILLDSPWGSGIPATLVMACGVWLVVQYARHNEIVWEYLPFETIVERDEVTQMEERSEEKSILPHRGSMDGVEEEYVQRECLPSTEPMEAPAHVSMAAGKIGDGTS